jgi:hypothetical protein
MESDHGAFDREIVLPAEVRAKIHFTLAASAGDVLAAALAIKSPSRPKRAKKTHAHRQLGAAARRSSRTKRTNAR